MNIIIPQNLHNIDALVFESQVLEPFSDIAVQFINEMSKNIFDQSIHHEFPELTSLAFWMRKANILKLKEDFFLDQNDTVTMGKGIVFHIAPSNVDTIFVYSWFLSLLAGNTNIIRISPDKSPQTILLLNIITSTLKKERYLPLKNRVAVIEYGHEDMITRQLSGMADMRVIWGGDHTINHIRTIPIKATASELTFADKFSFAIIKAQEVLRNNHLDTLIQNFYNDAYWFGQMACSSSRLIVWEGTPQIIEQAKNIFWQHLNSYVLRVKPEDISPADIVNKLVAECSMAIETTVHIKTEINPYINRIQIQNFQELNESLHCGMGLFYELDTENIEDVFRYTTKKHQTVSHYGFSKEELLDAVNNTKPQGIDRIVPIGKSLIFSHIWDGYNLLKSFCREIDIWS